jgi:hypothetical protein
MDGTIPAEPDAGVDAQIEAGPVINGDYRRFVVRRLRGHVGGLCTGGQGQQRGGREAEAFHEGIQFRFLVEL